MPIDTEDPHKIEPILVDTFRRGYPNFNLRSNDPNLMDANLRRLPIHIGKIHKSRDQHLEFREGDELLFQFRKIALNCALEGKRSE